MIRYYITLFTITIWSVCNIWLSGAAVISPRAYTRIQPISSVTAITYDQGLLLSRQQIGILSRHASSPAQLQHHIRIALTKALLSQWYTKRIARPYGSQWLQAINANRAAQSFSLTSTITATDWLDQRIQTKIPASDISASNQPASELFLTAQDIQNLGPIYLRKQPNDLSQLGYRIVSHRTRTTRDQPYRLHNIQTSLASIGYVRVIQPGETVRFLSSIGFDPRIQRKYKAWYGIFGNTEALIYGWGICGASTALYQGILTNQWLSVLSVKNHSKRYNAYYNSQINGMNIDIPGLDAMVFGGTQDLVFQNIRSYPIIIVSNVDGTYGSQEEVFTLSQTQDQWSIEYIWSFSTKSSYPSCTIRSVNGKHQERCYAKVIK